MLEKPREVPCGQSIESEENSGSCNEAGEMRRRQLMQPLRGHRDESGFYYCKILLNK